MNGAMFQMIAHGISSAGMFFMVGVIYDRVHHRNLDQFGGLFGRMPIYTGLAIVISSPVSACLACAVSLRSFRHAFGLEFQPRPGGDSAAVVILTAGYILWQSNASISVPNIKVRTAIISRHH